MRNGGNEVTSERRFTSSGHLQPGRKLLKSCMSRQSASERLPDFYSRSHSTVRTHRAQCEPGPSGLTHTCVHTHTPCDLCRARSGLHCRWPPAPPECVATGRGALGSAGACRGSLVLSNASPQTQGLSTAPVGAGRAGSPMPTLQVLWGNESRPPKTQKRKRI